MQTEETGQTSGQDIILDRYKVLEELASTRFSTVFKAFDTKMQRLVAIKMIESNSKATTWAKREAQLSAQLNHPNICTIYEYEETDQGHFLIMEYLEGLTLRDILDNCDTLTLDEAMAVAKEISVALEYAHLNYIIHQDIKPENVLLLHDGRLKIMDFGTGRLLGHIKEKQKSLIGTPAYMSPEQINKEHLDDRTDQFSLAVVIYECLSGVSPFDASSTQATVFKVINSKQQSLTKLNDDVDDNFAQTVDKALAKKADNRYVTVTDFRYKLDRAYPPPLSTKKVLAYLVARADVSDYEEDEELGDSIFDKIRGLNGRIYNRNRGFINIVFSMFLVAMFGFVAFNSFKQNYGLMAICFLAAVALFSFFKKNRFELSFSLASPILYYIKLQVLFPIFCGLAFSPVKAFVVSAFGALLVLAFSALDLVGVGMVEISQLVSWPIASFLISAAAKKGSFSRVVVATLSAFVFLTAIYIVSSTAAQGSFEAALKSLSLSLIITMVVLPLLPVDQDN